MNLRKYVDVPFSFLMRSFSLLMWSTYRCRGVWFFTPMLFTSAPLEISNRTISGQFRQTARWRGESSPEFLKFNLAPALRSADINFSVSVYSLYVLKNPISLFRTGVSYKHLCLRALSMGYRPDLPMEFTSALFSIKYSTMSNLSSKSKHFTEMYFGRCLNENQFLLA